MPVVLPWPLSPEIGERYIGVDDLVVHILETKPPNPSPPKALIVLLHGFPELSYSWRHVIIPLSKAGYHVVAPDLRGFGRTVQIKQLLSHHWMTQLEDAFLGARPVTYSDNLEPFGFQSLVGDIVGLVKALGYLPSFAAAGTAPRTTVYVVGHDFGSAVAGHCALLRPDIFTKVVLMSAPFTGYDSDSEFASRFDGIENPNPLRLGLSRLDMFNAALGGLSPPMKHYFVYFSTSQAATDLLCGATCDITPTMTRVSTGNLMQFFKAYFLAKGQQPASIRQPAPLSSLDVTEIAKLPHYYVMPLEMTMPEVVAPYYPTSPITVNPAWLTDEVLSVYTNEYARTGFQGGLNLYRNVSIGASNSWTRTLANTLRGRRMSDGGVKGMFLAGKGDWGVYQFPGTAQAMKDGLFGGTNGSYMEDEDFVLIEGAGHWVQQEKPEEVVQELLRFFAKES